MVEIKLKEGAKLNRPVVLEGFSGVGLIGTLATQYIAKKKDLEQIGHISVKGLPPIAIMEKGIIKEPIRIFANEKRNLVVIESSLPIPKDTAYDLADEITDWLKEINAKRIYCLEGIGATHIAGKPKTYSVSSKKRTEEELKKHLESLKKGIMVGTSALVLLKSKEKSIDAVCLMTQSHSRLPDGKAAAEQIRKLNKILGLNVSLKELEEKAEKFEKKLRKTIRKAKQAKKAIKKPEKAMYG